MTRHRSVYAGHETRGPGRGVTLRPITKREPKKEGREVVFSHVFTDVSLDVDSFQ